MPDRKNHDHRSNDPSKQLGVSVLSAVSALTILMTVGTIVFHHLEDWSWVSSFYFSVTTLTTVGYGDLTPTSDDARLFTAIYIIAGVAIALAAMTIVGRSYLTYIDRRLARNSGDLMNWETEKRKRLEREEQEAMKK